MKGSDYLAIGEIVRPHGVKGKVGIRFLGQDRQILYALRDILVGSNPQDSSVHRILRVQPHKGLFILEIEGFTFEKALSCVGDLIWSRRDQLPPLEEGEYYWQDLIGLRLITDSGQCIGEVKSVFSTGSNDVLVCEGEGKEFLVPFTEDAIGNVDLEEGFIYIHEMEGLF